VGQAESLYTRIVSTVEVTVDNDSDAESRSDGVANEVVKALLGTHVFKALIDFRQYATEGFAIGEEVAVVVDEYGHTEALFQHRAECYAITERGEVGKETSDDAAGIVGGAREGKTNGNRALRGVREE
jgi:hypothetical protein